MGERTKSVKNTRADQLHHMDITLTQIISCRALHCKMLTMIRALNTGNHASELVYSNEILIALNGFEGTARIQNHSTT